MCLLYYLFAPRNVLVGLMCILLKNLVLGMSIRVSVTYMGGGGRDAILLLISDLNQEVLSGPIGSTVTWW